MSLMYGTSWRFACLLNCLLLSITVQKSSYIFCEVPMPITAMGTEVGRCWKFPGEARWSLK